MPYTSTLYTRDIALMQPCDSLYPDYTLLFDIGRQQSRLPLVSLGSPSTYSNKKRQHGNPPPPNPETQKGHIIKLSPMQPSLQPNHHDEHLI